MENYEKYTIDSLFEAVDPIQTTEIVWRSRPATRDGIADPEDENLIQIAGESINIVAARNVRANVHRSIRMALDLAASGSRVLYLNSYAGMDLLRTAIQSNLPQDAKASKSIRERVTILSFPIGMMSQSIEEAEEEIYEDNYIDGEDERTQWTDVLILNSYEFATFSYRNKLDLASTLLNWAAAVPITLVVFTQEISSYMSAGVPVRGPLGLLTASAATVSKLGMTSREHKMAELQS